MSTDPISVIVPVFNSEAYLAAALECIFQQNVLPEEIIVVNDGSTDGTRDVMNGFGSQIRAIHQTNQGPAAARNAALEVASGKMIAFLDADDLWPRNHLRLLLECLHASPGIGAGLGRMQHISAKSSLDHPSLVGEPIATQSLGCGLFRRAAFASVGYLDESLRFSEDVDWFMRAREAGITMMLRQEVVLYYRQHDSNMTNVSDFKDLGLLRTLKKSIARRKKEQGAGYSLDDFLKFEEPL